MEEYIFLDDIATADVAIESRGDTLEELFTASAMATFEVMADTGNIHPEIKKALHLEHSEIDGLLFDWLAEIIYLKDSESMLFGKYNLKITKNTNSICTLRKFNQKRKIWTLMKPLDGLWKVK